MLLAIIPLPIALSLSLFSETGELSILSIILVFGFGLALGTFTHIYWIRVLLKEREFYQRFYAESVAKPHKNDRDMHKKHTRILLPFYLFSALMFIIVIILFAVFGLDFEYFLPLMLGALEGVPLSYYLIESGVFS